MGPKILYATGTRDTRDQGTGVAWQNPTGIVTEARNISDRMRSMRRDMARDWGSIPNRFKNHVRRHGYTPRGGRGVPDI